MAGGGVGRGKRDDGSVVVNSTNGFALLGSLRKKKKNDKGSSSAANNQQEKGSVKKEVFWAPTPLTVKSWADVDDEDDDDYYATTAPPQSVWSSSVVDQSTEKEIEGLVEESDSEDIDEVDDEVEEDHENEEAVEIVIKPLEVSSAPKDTDRQLSKKELKKKGLEELDAVLAELGYPNKVETSDQDGARGAAEEKKAENDNGELEKIEKAPPGESKSGKKKKKKDKSAKEVKQSQDLAAANIENGTNDKTEDDASTSTIDVKERLKKVTSMKKKKSTKEMDAAAKAAASEAATRNAKLAASKKKEKNHYNQQPMR